MRDLNLSRLISIATTGTIIVTSAGCGGKKDESSNSSSPDRQEAIARACDVNQKCAPEEFAADFVRRQIKGERDAELLQGLNCAYLNMRLARHRLPALGRTTKQLGRRKQQRRYEENAA